MVSIIVCMVILVAAIFGVIVGVRRGMLWALLSLSLAWVALIAVIAYEWPALGGRYEVGYRLRDGLPQWEKEWKFSEPLKKPLYEIIHSPSEDKLPVTFISFREYGRTPPWTNHVNANKRQEYEFADGSALLLPVDLTENDRKYVTEEFWNQRWGRWLVRLKPWFGAASILPLILACVLIPIWVMRRFGVAPN